MSAITPDRWNEVEQLYHAALECKPEERLAFLKHICRDEQLRREVQSLLEHEQEGDQLLENRPWQSGISEDSGPSLSSGARLGPYEILARIGAGGMGEVYRARDTRLDRTVAIKVVPGHFSENPQRRERFVREARAVSRLNHQHICTLYDLGHQDSTDYLVMEYLEGETLAQKLKKGRMPLDQALHLAIEIAGALDHAHRHGVTHRDLKPANIMLTKAGATVLDFGVAKVRARDAVAVRTQPTNTLTEDGAMVGTLQYMAPEQLEGKEADGRSDIFAFGAVLYETVTGRKAFEGENQASLISAILSSEPPPASLTEPLSPPLLDRVIQRCLAKDPGERWQSAADLAEALHWIATAPAPAKTQTRKTRWPIWAGVAVGGALAIAALGVWWGRSTAMEPPTLRYLTYSGHDYSPAASPDGRTVAFSSDRDGRSRIWLKDLARGDEAVLTAGPSDDFPRFSPDGSMILFSRGKGAQRRIRVDKKTSAFLYRVAAIGGEPRKLLDDVYSADWSPDGRQIAFIRDRSKPGQLTFAIGLVGADGTGAREITQVDGFDLLYPRWSPDGRTIAVTQYRGFSGTPASLFLVRSDGKESRQLSAAPGGYAISSLAWSGSGEELVYSQNESAGFTGIVRIVRQNVTSGVAHSVLRVPHNSLANERIFDIVSLGRVVFESSSPRQSLREVSLRGTMSSPQTRWLTHGNSQDRQPAYSPDGEWVIFSSDRSGNLDLWEVSTKTGAVRRITDDPADDWDPAFTPDGKHIVWTSNRTGHFEIWIAEADGSGARQVTQHGTDAANPTATPDGWIVYVYADVSGQYGIGKIRQDGSEAKRLAVGQGIPEASPDGHYVAQPDESDLRVIRIADGAAIPFPIQGTAFRCRWMPDGRSIVFMGTDERGVWGAFVQNFLPGEDTRRTRKPFHGFDSDLLAAETFGFSPDGSRMTVTSGERLDSLMMAERIPGVSPPRRMR